jgi:hypothetical protein
LEVILGADVWFRRDIQNAIEAAWGAMVEMHMATSDSATDMTQRLHLVKGGLIAVRCMCRQFGIDPDGLALVTNGDDGEVAGLLTRQENEQGRQSNC